MTSASRHTISCCGPPHCGQSSAFSDDDDGVPPVNGTLFYNALKAASVPGEIHIYPTGGHGWGWNETFKYKDEFRNSLVRWLSERLGE